MGVIELLALGAVGAVAVVGAIAAAVARDRRRRNQVVPGTETGAPVSWAGAHTPEARLHRRLRAAVQTARAVADPDGSLLAARVEIERAATATDRHLVALAAMPERHAAGRMPDARAAVAAIETAAASLADVGDAGREVIATAGPGRLASVERAAERVQALREAMDEVDEVDVTVDPGRAPRSSVRVHRPDPAGTGDVSEQDVPSGDDDDEPEATRQQPG